MPRPETPTSVSTHHAAAGTSLIGHITAKFIVGLAPSSRPANAPATTPDRRVASMLVPMTATAPSSGTAEEHAGGAGDRVQRRHDERQPGRIDRHNRTGIDTRSIAERRERPVGIRPGSRTRERLFDHQRAA